MNTHTAEQARPAPSWERWLRLLGDWFPYLTLAHATVLSLLQHRGAWAAFGWTAALAGLAAAWVYALYTRAPHDRRAQPARMVVYFAGLLALAGVLMAREPVYFAFAITGLFHAQELRPWPLMFAGVGLTSILINTVITGFPWPDLQSWLIFGTIIVVQTFAIAFGTLLAERLARVSEERRQAVARLEAALAENASLQAELVARAREAGVAEERQRLAREIHDTLAQGLIGIITQLGALQQAHDRPADWRRHLEHAQQLARESLAEARRSVDALRPQPLEAADLPNALAQFARQWMARSGVPVEVTTTGEPVSLHPEIEAALLRTAQEALANVAKHAHASRVGVTLSYVGDAVLLDVRDDGRGFDPASARARAEGFGLTAMQQRLGRVGGRLEVEAEPGAGTAISARVPLIPAAPEPAAP